MKLLSEIKVEREHDKASVQLLHGDLSAIPPEHFADILVVSAYPGSYVPSKNTLVAALHQKGISVGELANDKEIDLLKQLDCWLSKPITQAQQKQLNFKQILCFEPGIKVQEDKEVVGNIFRCINAFAFEKSNNVVAMPVVASGNQKVSLVKMLPAIAEAALFWLENGLPLNTIKLVLLTEDQVLEALPELERIKKEYELGQLLKTSVRKLIKPKRSIHKSRGIIKRGSGGSFKKGRFPGAGSDEFSYEESYDPSPEEDYYADEEETPVPKMKKEESYDYFVSYAHANAQLVEPFVEQLKQKDSRLNIFFDSESIPMGGLWLKRISEAIQRSKKVLVFLSPEYDNSKVCWDEFQCAKVKEYKSNNELIQTIYLYKYEIPLIMAIHSYVDCTEGDLNKLLAAVPKFVH